MEYNREDWHAHLPIRESDSIIIARRQGRLAWPERCSNITELCNCQSLHKGVNGIIMADSVRWEPFRDLIALRQAMDLFFEEGFIRPGTGRLAPWNDETLAVDTHV